MLIHVYVFRLDKDKENRELLLSIFLYPTIAQSSKLQKLPFRLFHNHLYVQPQLLLFLFLLPSLLY